MRALKLYFQTHSDNRGQLIALEENKNIPFRIRRVYYMYGIEKGVVRGKHAHKSLKQVLICIHGKCAVRLDNGRENRVYLLDNPNEGLFVSNMMWREMFDFSPDAVLLVLASELYDEADYIRNYDEFLEHVRNNGDTEPAGEVIK